MVTQNTTDLKCESCGKSFSQAGDLKKHIHTIHEGHKNYKWILTLIHLYIFSLVFNLIIKFLKSNEGHWNTYDIILAYISF